MMTNLSLTKRKKNLPLVSIIVVSYNNTNLLYDSLKSVMRQNYGNIELLISDDATSAYQLEDGYKALSFAMVDIKQDKVFPLKNTKENDIKKTKHQQSYWKNRKENFGYDEMMSILSHDFMNFKNVRFYRNTVNIGTVKHLKQLKREASGKYIMFLAADDELHDERVVTDLIKRFEKLPDDSYVLTSQCGMYDENLEELRYYAVTDEIQNILLRSTPKELFGELTDWCIIPACGTVYKKEVFDLYGDLDSQYHLIEDWTYFLRITYSGAKIYYFDRLTYKHRDGGISHGNSTAGKNAYLAYLNDCILLTEKEIFPYMDELTEKQKKRVIKRYKNTIREKEKKYVLPGKSILYKMGFICRYGTHYFPKLIRVVLDFVEFRATWAYLLGCLLLFLHYILIDAPMIYLLPFSIDYIGLAGLLLIIFVVAFKGFRFIWIYGEKAVKYLKDKNE